MKAFKTKVIALGTFLFLLISITSNAQHSMELIPVNTATHTAITSGSWFDVNSWDAGSVPGEGAIVYIPSGIVIDYEGCSTDHIFAIRLDGEMNIVQTDQAQTTCLTFDTFLAEVGSYLKVHADGASDGQIELSISPFDIEGYKGGVNSWNAMALMHFTDGDPVYTVTYDFPADRRYNTYAEAMASGAEVTEATRAAYDDGVGVTGRYGWDEEQLSLGLITMGQLEIIGQEKLSMSKLASDALSGQNTITLEEVPEGWEVGDLIVVGRDGTSGRNSRQEDEVIIQNVSGNSVTLTSNLGYNHEGNTTYDLHTYVGNLERNIKIQSTDVSNVHRRGHFMHMHNNVNMQVRNAAFIDMGRTDKSKLTDDFRFDTWVDSDLAQTMYSPLGQEICQMKKNDPQDITNSRGRYSIHMHKTGAALNDQMVYVTGCVVWGNPGWGITHHDSYANVADNFVYEVKGAGIVSESGSELGFWDHNLVMEVQNANTDIDPYDAALWFDDLLFSGQGLGMKGRAVICRDNVIIGVQNGIGILNLNPSISNHDRVDPLALRAFRTQYSAAYDFDQYPLDHNGYSAEGDGVVPVELELIMENNTVIEADRGFRSLERDQGLSHESRSVFDGFIIWGAREGIDIVYQADYSYKDLTIVGRGTGTTGGIVLWKHAYNHTFDNVQMADLEYAIGCSDFTNSTDVNVGRVRNNGSTPWVFLDLSLDNVNNLYEFTNGGATQYTDHPDNVIHLSSSDIESRPTLFTIVDSSDLSVDLSSDDFRFEVDGFITDDFGTYNYGLKQCATFSGTQVTRVDYEARIYEFASKEKFEEYLGENGVYRNAAGELYFILTEYVPNRRTFEYTGFPIRVKILNAPATGIYASPQVEISTDSEYQLVSHFNNASVAQSSTQTGLAFLGASIDASAFKANDGNDNGRENFDRYQAGFQSYVGSFSQTQVETNPWFDIALTDTADIKYIDIWNTVDMNGTSIETPSSGFRDFYVLIADSPFTDSDLATARVHAHYEAHFGDVSSQRKASLVDLGVSGRYIRIQAEGNTFLKLAEIYVIGKTNSDEDPCLAFSLGEDKMLCENVEEVVVAHLPVGNQTMDWFKDGVLLAETSNTLTVTAAGTYSITYSGLECTGTDTIVIGSYIPEVIGDTVCAAGEEATLTASGTDDIVWYDAVTDGTELETGGSYTPIINSTTIYYVANESSNTEVFGKPDQEGATYANTGSGAYLNYGRVSQLVVESELTLVSVDVFSNGAANATVNIINISDASDNHTLNFTGLVAGRNTLSLNVELGIATYTLDFDGSDGGFLVEYQNVVSQNTVTDLVTYTNSSGLAWYGMLYNITVQTGGPECVRVPVTAQLDALSPECVMNALNELSTDQTAVFPNPTTGKVHFTESATYEILNSSGVLLKSGEGSETDLSTFDSGVYLIKMAGEIYKVVKE
jgi:hypothetical protein